MERARVLGNVQGGVAYQDMDTDVDVYSIRDLGNAIETTANQFADLAKQHQEGLVREKEALEAQAEREYYLEAQAIQLSDLPSSEKEDALYMLDQKFVGRRGLGVSEAIASRNFLGASLKEMVSHQIEQKQLELAAQVEYDRTKETIRLANTVFPFTKNLNVEQQIRYGDKVRALKSSIENVGVTMLTVDDEDVKKQAQKTFTTNYTELLRASLLDTLSKNKGEELSNKDIADFYNFAAKGVQQILSSTGYEADKAVIAALSNEIAKEVADPLLEQIKYMNTLDDESTKRFINATSIAAFNELPYATQKDIALSYKFDLPDSLIKVIDTFMRDSTKKPPVTKGTVFPKVVVPGYVDTSVPLTLAGKQIAAQSAVKEASKKDMSSARSQQSVASFNTDRQMNEGIASLPEEERIELRDIWIEANAPVLASMLLSKDYARDTYVSGREDETELHFAEGWFDKESNRKQFYAGLKPDVKKYLRSFKESALFTTDYDINLFKDAVVIEMGRIKKETGNVDNPWYREAAQAITRFMFDVKSFYDTATNFMTADRAADYLSKTLK